MKPMARKPKPVPAATPGGAFHSDLTLPVEYRRQEHCAALSAMIEEARAAGSMAAVASLTKQLAELGGLSAPIVDEAAVSPEPRDYVDGLRERLATARDVRQRAIKAGSFGSAAQLLHQELNIMALIAEAERASAATVEDVSDAELVESIAADVQALPPTVRAAVLARLSAPVLRVVKASNG